jgi:hypothetical protein
MAQINLTYPLPLPTLGPYSQMDLSNVYTCNPNASRKGAIFLFLVTENLAIKPAIF